MQAMQPSQPLQSLQPSEIVQVAGGTTASAPATGSLPGIPRFYWED